MKDKEQALNNTPTLSQEQCRMLGSIYPFNPGVRGIHFSHVLREVQNSRDNRLTTAEGSGRKLTVHATPTSITVKDLLQPRFNLKSTANKQSMFQVFWTRDYDSHTGEISPPHPDLFTSRFTQLSLAYFSYQGFDIRFSQGKFQPGSLNYALYMRAIQAEMPKEEAIKQTAAYKIMEAFGFYLDDNSGIAESKINHHHTIFVTLKRH